LSFSIKNTFSKNIKDFSNFFSISLPSKHSPPFPSKLANKALGFKGEALAESGEKTKKIGFDCEVMGQNEEHR
jgi:hypothetical protein